MKRFFLRPCANCGSLMHANVQQLYCSDLCRQIPKFIRYVKRRRVEGTDSNEDIDYAIKIRMAHIYSGGYPDTERRITGPAREAVFEKYSNRCAQCGEVGTDVDHIAGSASALENLQLLCWECHRDKSEQSLQPVSPMSVHEIYLPIMRRLEMGAAQQPSDDLRWNHRIWALDCPKESAAKDAWRIIVKRDFGQSKEPISIGAAALGFPSELKAWSWYFPDY